MAATDVDVYLDSLSHAHLAGIRSLRAAILATDPRIVERVKWNAPSFGLGADDVVTMRLAPKDAFQLVFHRGVERQAGSVRVDDPDGLLGWRSGDRAVVEIGGREAELEPALVALVRAWIAAASAGIARTAAEASAGPSPAAERRHPHG
jgi:hypothetical protein